MKLAAVSQRLEANLPRRFDDNGFHILPALLADSDCDALASELTPKFERQQLAARRTIGGVRNLLRASLQVAAVANSQELISLVRRLLGATAFPVRAIFFDKTPGANWNVPWHQDLVIAVAGRIETPGFGPWSVKEGVVHAKPPPAVLEKMLAVRIHLDPCHADNGPLRVIPGSHRGGELGADEINDWTTRKAPVACEVSRGGVLLMRPLLLHASSAAKAPSHRRVIHIEYAAAALPNGLLWFEQ